MGFGAMGLGQTQLAPNYFLVGPGMPCGMFGDNMHVCGPDKTCCAMAGGIRVCMEDYKCVDANGVQMPLYVCSNQPQGCVPKAPVAPPPKKVPPVTPPPPVRPPPVTPPVTPPVQPPPTKAECKIFGLPCVAVGIGAAALGVIYFATRKKRRV